MYVILNELNCYQLTQSVIRMLSVYILYIISFQFISRPLLPHGVASDADVRRVLVLTIHCYRRLFVLLFNSLKHRKGPIVSSRVFSAVPFTVFLVHSTPFLSTHLKRTVACFEE